MLFWGHLVIGLITGFILYEFCHDQNAIIFCTLGSVLPDIVDKPLGHFFLNSVLDNGKIYFHSLIIFFLFIITGIIVWKYYRSNSFLYVGLGIIIHQIVDLMWKLPVNWYYPLLGPYQVQVQKDYFIRAIISELSSGTEWVFFIAVLTIVILAGNSKYQNQPVLMPEPLKEQQQHQLYSGLLGIAIFVLILSVAIICLTQWY
jgi:hypothetical protein